jgi:hypothetical protein
VGFTRGAEGSARVVIGFGGLLLFTARGGRWILRPSGNVFLYYLLVSLWACGFAGNQTTWLAGNVRAFVLSCVRVPLGPSLMCARTQ